MAGSSCARGPRQPAHAIIAQGARAGALAGGVAEQAAFAQIHDRNANQRRIAALIAADAYDNSKDGAIFVPLVPVKPRRGAAATLDLIIGRSRGILYSRAACAIFRPEGQE
jgi:hypothetical protein